MKAARSVENAPPKRVPGGSVTFRIDGVNGRLAESFFTMFNDRFKLGKRHELERLHEVLFFPGSCRAAAPFAARVRFFPMHPLANEIGRTFGAGFVRSLENDSVAKVQDGYFGFFSGSKSREKRELGLCGHDRGSVGLTDHVYIRI